MMKRRRRGGLVRSICGAILISRDPDALARFYARGLGLALRREDHAGLAPHWGVDIGNIHFGIHPPANFRLRAGRRAGARPGRASLAFHVTSLAACRRRLSRLGARCVQPPHDEGFGPVASYADPEGNLFEIVELKYDFGGGD